jgi:hypothetical protein
MDAPSKCEAVDPAEGRRKPSAERSHCLHQRVHWYVVFLFLSSLFDNIDHFFRVLFSPSIAFLGKYITNTQLKELVERMGGICRFVSCPSLFSSSQFTLPSPSAMSRPAPPPRTFSPRTFPGRSHRRFSRRRRRTTPSSSRRNGLSSARRRGGKYARVGLWLGSGTRSVSPLSSVYSSRGS